MQGLSVVRMSKFIVILSWLGMIYAGDANGKPRELSFTRGGELGGLSLWRGREEGVALRYRVKSMTHSHRLPSDHEIVKKDGQDEEKEASKEAESQAGMELEISHLNSGCALSLWWSGDQNPVARSWKVGTPKPVSKREVRTYAASWGKLKSEARGLRFNLSIAAGTRLNHATWHGCGWATQRDQGEDKRKGKPKLTLPDGAKSTRPIFLGASMAPQEPKEKVQIQQRDEKTLILRSARWAFEVTLSAQGVTPIKNSEGEWIWEVLEDGGRTAPKITVTLWHASSATEPLSDPPMIAQNPQFAPWGILLDYLSTSEGIVDGIGAKGTTRQWAGLALLATLDDKELAALSTAWCEALFVGAIKELPAWPHPFRAYKKPLKPLDGRLLLPIALERYLLHHPEGKKRAAQFLKTRVKGRMIGGLLQRQIQALIGRAAFFANRPSQRHLIAIHPDPLEVGEDEALKYGYVESVTLMPRALRAIKRLLRDVQLRGLISASVGLDTRAQQLEAKWRKEVRGFFGRHIETYEARRRVEQWGRFLGLPEPETPMLKIKTDLKFYEAEINQTPPRLGGFLGYDLLWGMHEQIELVQLINSLRPFPAGLATPSGMLAGQSLLFIDQLTPRPVDHLTPTMSVSAIWLKGIRRQLKRGWPAKLTFILEDARAAIWSGVVQGNQAVTKDKPHDPWLSDDLSALDGLALTLKAPPPIVAPTGVDSRELRSAQRH